MLFQVNRILRKRTVFSQIFRSAHNDHSTAKSLIPLESRKLIKIIGEDVSVFLQGLITNDMGHFEEGAKSMYAMFLNTKGRVLYDTLVHQWDDSFMIECDVMNLALLQKHLNFFKLKRKIKVQDVSKDFKVWALISADIAAADLEIDPRREVNLYKDPRLADLGFRIIASNSLTGNSIATALGKDLSIQDNEKQYKYLRYRLGVSEGAEDLPPGTSFPLEANCDYLHGVSFHKGCYIGQEVTARVHHTGVVRKRIMSLKFTEIIKDNLEIDSVISASNSPKSNVGKLKGVACDHGLGLMRIKEALDAKILTVGNYSVEALKPSWWPVEAPKEKINIAKLESPQQ